MSDFEKIYQTDPDREESISIELSDEEIILKNISKYKKMKELSENYKDSIKSTVIIGHEVPKIETRIDSDILTKYKFSDEAIKGIKDEKSKSKNPKRKSLKNDKKSDKAAVESVQKKLS